jgi:ABC-2 type transport system permease protein
MKAGVGERVLIAIPVVAVAVGLRILVFRRRRARKAGQPAVRRQRTPGSGWSFLGPAGLVAGREIKARVRARAFRVVTLLLLVVVAAAIVIPVATRGKTGPVRVGVVGTFTPTLRAALLASARSNGIAVSFVTESSKGAAESDLRAGNLDLAIIDADEIVVARAIGPDDSSNQAQIVQSWAAILGLEASFDTAGLTQAQISQITRSRPVPVDSLAPAAPARASSSASRGTSILGIIIVFVMLTQYETWTMIGVMEEKSSRVVEVLLATVRPLQLLGGKVLGIGAVAISQATTLLLFGLGLAAAVGSNILHGKSVTVLLASLLWLILGYSFYCWVYAAAGSMAERQDQVQSLALPLGVPMIVGYILALTAASSGSASLFVKVLAYVPPTAPFEMPLLVGLGDVSWWGFALSVLLTLVATVGVARVAAIIYRRAVLRTGRKVPLRDVLPGLARS